MSNMTLKVNGRSHTLDIEPATPLLYILRNDLGLQGPKFGCGLGQCGACTVIINGAAVRSCILPVSAVRSEVTTLEGLSSNGKLHPLQEAFLEVGASQCGYCTPGMLMSTTALLRENASPSEDEIKKALQGNICRCTGYWNIFEAVKAAAK